MRYGVSLRAQSFRGIVEVELDVVAFGERNPFRPSNTHSESQVSKFPDEVDGPLIVTGKTPNSIARGWLGSDVDAFVVLRNH